MTSLVQEITKTTLQSMHRDSGKRSKRTVQNSKSSPESNADQLRGTKGPRVSFNGKVQEVCEIIAQNFKLKQSKHVPSSSSCWSFFKWWWRRLVPHGMASQWLCLLENIKQKKREGERCRSRKKERDREKWKKVPPLVPIAKSSQPILVVGRFLRLSLVLATATANCPGWAHLAEMYPIKVKLR